MQRSLGAVAAVVTWLAWFAICPVLGFPNLATAGMINRIFFPTVPEAGHNPGYWIGLVIVIAALGLAAIGFFLLDRTRFVHPGVATGLLYGVLLWLLAGVVIMPLLGLLDPSVTQLGKNDAMRATLMMGNLGPLAALAALIGWLLFGGVLGAASTSSGDVHHGLGQIR
jgi:hypothetical protein